MSEKTAPTLEIVVTETDSTTEEATEGEGITTNRDKMANRVPKVQPTMG